MVSYDVHPNIYLSLGVKISDLHLGVRTDPGDVGSNHTLGTALTEELYVPDEFAISTT
jgi:hypothetical protein